MSEGILTELIPIFGIFMIVAVVIGPIWIKNYFAAKDRANLHETLRAAYEKGQPVPPELIQSLQKQSLSTPPLPTPERDLRRGVILIAVALGLAGTGDVSAYWSGDADWMAMVASSAIPGLIGLAYILLWLSKRGVSKT